MPDELTSTEPQALRCAAHPQVETYLRCGRCGTPICPRCLIQTPVGARCRTCARLRRLPIYDVQPRFLLRGALAGLTAAFVGGVLLRLIPSFGLFMFLVLGALYGYAVAGAVSAATNYKRGASLAWITVAAILIGFCLSSAALAYLQLTGLPEAGRLARALAHGFRPDLGWLAIGVAALIAYNRLR